MESCKRWLLPLVANRILTQLTTVLRSDRSSERRHTIGSSTYPLCVRLMMNFAGHSVALTSRA